MAGAGNTDLEREIQAVRRVLEDEKLVVRDGLKYGLNFLVYTSDPELVHSKYGVLVNYKGVTYKEIIMAQRVCNSNRKRLIIADCIDGSVKFMEVSRFLPSNKRNEN